jgi:tetratricopeptide (TPR) repeat protein
MSARAQTIILAVTLWSTAAHSQAPVASARAHFEAGLASIEGGEFDAALRHFREAYSLGPRFAVLYNIAQAEAALGHPVEALKAFEQYLRDGGDQITPPRRREVETLLASTRKQIGQLRISAAAPNLVRIWLDGVELGAEQLGHPLPVKVGEHRLLHASTSSPPTTEVITVVAAETTDVALPAPRALPGLLKVTCPVPGAAVDVNGLRTLTTPIVDEVTVPAGPLTVRFRRRGYRFDDVVMNITPNRVATAKCTPRLNQALPPNERALLKVTAIPNDVSVFVDGQPYRGQPLPPGPHFVQISRDGYVSKQSELRLEPGRTLTYPTTLRLTPESYARQAREAARRRSIGYVLGASGAAFLLAGGGLYSWNNGRYDDWQSSRNVSTDLDRALSIQRIDDVAIALLVAGLLSEVGAASLLLWSPPPAP